MIQQLNITSQRATSDQPSGLGSKIRHIADQLAQETDIQIKATSSILSAAAKISNNHDRLIREVVDMIEKDLDNQTRVSQTTSFTGDMLKQQFGTLSEAKSHFGLTANSWATLANKLNNSSIQTPISTHQTKISVSKRLDAIEGEIKTMRTEINQIFFLLKQLISDEK
jgi:ATP-dependent Lon protease